jgi:TolB-like protein/DNA-binding SARP family transcriptional activator/Flp pilus assembly protein TadD
VYTLRLLGTASIEEAHRLVTGRAAQGPRLALLAMLALARDRALSRDKLVGILWPEASHVRARPQLSDAVYILRSALGDDVIRSTGDGLALDPDRLTSDVVLFEQAVEEGRLEDAVELYGGPLLDGFHISGSIEFENWLDGERARVDRLYSNALEGLAEAAEGRGDVDTALGWWRRRAAHDPHNSRVALRLMRALEASGDRAGALKHARIHSTLLRHDFDADPDPEVTAFAERLRHEPPTPPAPVTGPSAPVTGPPAPAPGSFAPVTDPPTQPPLQASGSVPAAAEAASLSASPAAVHPALPPTPPAAPTTARSRLGLVAGLSLLLVLALAVAVAQLGRASAPAPARSVGVLPFVNMSPDPANTYFGDGLSEQIILALSRIDGLRVAARTSSFALRNRELSARAIGDTLDVQAVLEGSLLVEGDQLRVIAQLVDARTGFHIWSEQYDGDLRQAFAVQDRIASAIAEALHLRLAGTPTRPDAPPPTLEAYDLYLRGLHLRNSLSADALRQASDLFDRVIELEPRFALAWAAKASVLAPQAYFRYAPRDSVVAELRALTTRALELDPTLGEAHVSLGVLALFYDWDWEAAEVALHRAVELNPNDAHAWHHLGNYYSSTGQVAETLTARERSVRLDPLNARTRAVLARDYLVAGDYDRALEQARRAAQLDPSHPLLLGAGPSLPAGAGEVLLRQGREGEAIEEYLRVAALRGATVDELRTMRDAHAASGMTGFWKAWLAMDLRQSGPSPDPFRMAATYLASGDTARALDWLDRAFDERNPGLIYLRRDPVIGGMRGHPRVERIAEAMGLPR